MHVLFSEHAKTFFYLPVRAKIGGQLPSVGPIEGLPLYLVHLHLAQIVQRAPVALVGAPLGGVPGSRCSRGNSELHYYSLFSAADKDYGHVVDVGFGTTCLDETTRPSQGVVGVIVP